MNSKREVIDISVLKSESVNQVKRKGDYLEDRAQCAEDMQNRDLQLKWRISLGNRREKIISSTLNAWMRTRRLPFCFFELETASHPFWLQVPIGPYLFSFTTNIVNITRGKRVPFFPEQLPMWVDMHDPKKDRERQEKYEKQSSNVKAWHLLSFKDTNDFVPPSQIWSRTQQG